MKAKLKVESLAEFHQNTKVVIFIWVFFTAFFYADHRNLRSVLTG